MSELVPELWVWRHPRPHSVAGRCIGVTDVPLDPRKARRLADRIRRTARRHGLPHCVLTSTLRRSADVGRWLRRWGWQHEIVPALGEMDFGNWDGREWSQISRHEIDVWCADFMYQKPGGGESLAALFHRVAGSRTIWAEGTAPFLVVGHAGWMLAMRCLVEGRTPPMRANDWPAPPPYGWFWQLDVARI